MDLQDELLELLDKKEWSEADYKTVSDYLEKADTSGLNQLLLERFAAGMMVSTPSNLEAAGQLLNTIHEKIGVPLSSKSARVLFLFSKSWWVAASAVTLIGAGTYFLFFNKPEKTNTVVEKMIAHDIKAPAINRATITLGNGQKIFLDSAKNGMLATQDNIKISKLADGEIAYNGHAQLQKEIVYNTLTNPRGSKVIDITLEDGTHVWLNSGSSMTYPTAFIGDKRKVSINGEAYFEVARDAKKPFIVSVTLMDVEVLGTHFDINAYDDEPSKQATLLQGSVRIRAHGVEKIIKPGEQASVKAGQKGVEIKTDADLEQVMAWKNGQFLFQSADLETIMRQVARWYDVEVNFTAPVKEKFNVSISRNTNASNLFKMLAINKGAHFTIEGNTITVSP